MFIGMGKQGSERIYEVLKNHIVEGSNIYHDGDPSHRLLIDRLNLVDYTYKSKRRNGRYDLDNLKKLEPVNDECKNLNFFLDKHRGFKKEDSLQNYLNLYSFIVNHKNSDSNNYMVTYDLFLRIISKKQRYKY